MLRGEAVNYAQAEYNENTIQLTHTDVHKLGDMRTVGLKADGNNT